jgi:hypothetical protein
MPAQALNTDAAEVTLRVRRGDQLIAHVSMEYRTDGSPVDLTGSTIRGNVSPYRNPLRRLLDLGVTVEEPQNLGRLTLRLTEDETASLAGGAYRWRLKWQTGRDETHTILRGILEVIDEVQP